MALGVAAPVAPALAAGPVIDSVVIKLRDGAVADPAGGLTNDEQAALFDEVQTPFAHVGYTRDGALRLQLLNPLPLDAARAAVNRVRMMPQVLYANVVPPAPAAGIGAPSTPTAAPAQPPVRRLIVKFRDAATTAAAHRNEALAKPQLDRLSTLASQPLSHERAMSGGAYVVRLFQALPVDQARLVAAHMATDPAIEYAEPDLLMQPLLVPNDTRYPEQWHYMSPSVAPGGANLPPAWDLTTGSLGIVVAVLDTGYLPLHPDLAGRFVGGYDFISLDVPRPPRWLRNRSPPMTATAATPIRPILGTGSHRPRAGMPPASSTGCPSRRQFVPRLARGRHDRRRDWQWHRRRRDQLGEQDPAGPRARQMRRLHVRHRRRDSLVGRHADCQRP